MKKINTSIFVNCLFKRCFSVRDNFERKKARRVWRERKNVYGSSVSISGHIERGFLSTSVGGLIYRSVVLVSTCWCPVASRAGPLRAEKFITGEEFRMRTARCAGARRSPVKWAKKKEKGSRTKSEKLEWTGNDISIGYCVRNTPVDKKNDSDFLFPWKMSPTLVHLK